MNRMDELPLALRHRSRWEAVDSGILLWRDNFAFLLLFFAMPLWLAAFGLRFIPDRLRYLSWIILWLLRPLFERSALHVISVCFFEKDAGLKRLCHGLFKTLGRGLLADLSWRRFSSLRAAMLPVRTLEALRFRQIRERRRILKKGGLGFCSLLTLWSFAMEVILLCGELLFLVISLEILQPGLFSGFKDIIDGWELYIYVAWCVNSMLIGSLYVCMGFSLYLNSRIELEGWDLEIIFRRLAEKNKRKKPQAALIIFMMCGVALPHANASAEENLPDSRRIELPIPAVLPDTEHSGGITTFIINGDTPIEDLHTILDSPDFGGERDGWGIRLRKAKEKKPADFNLNFNPLLEKIKQTFAVILRTALIGLIVFIAILIFRYVRKYRGRGSLFARSSPLQPIPPGAQTDIHAMLAQSQELFDQGRLRYAWGLCVAAIFKSLTVYHGVAFPPGATEYDCITAARTAGGDQLAVPVNHWIAFAYGGRLPPADSFGEAVAYCRSLALPAAKPDDGTETAPGTLRDGEHHE